jgi:hypothetical protein
MHVKKTDGEHVTFTIFNKIEPTYEEGVAGGGVERWRENETKWRPKRHLWQMTQQLQEFLLLQTVSDWRNGENGPTENSL